MPAGGGGGGGGALISPVPASQREESGVGLLDQGRAWTEWTGPTSHTCGSALLHSAVSPHQFYANQILNNLNGLSFTSPLHTSLHYIC